MESVLSIDDIHVIQLEMLEKIDHFLNENHLNYFLCAGTLLGAIRHHGFIPWDDDVDIAMPRLDYNKLLSILSDRKIEGIRLLNYHKDTDYRLPFAKFIDESTVLKETGTYDQKLGVYIDVFPVDIIPEKKHVQKKLIRKCRFNFYMLYLQLQDKRKPFNLRQLINEVILKPVAKRKSFKYYSEIIDTYAQSAADSASDTYCILAHSILAKNDFEKDELFPTKLIPFGDLMLPVPNQSDMYLKKLYGDYMTPPPEEARKGKHNVEAWKIIK